MAFDESFIRSKARSLLSRYSGLKAPVDLQPLCDLAGIRQVEYRPMIPEGVLSVVDGGFHLFVQNNFDRIGVSHRVRFTISHEISHTFFYDASQSPPKRLRRAPRDQRLERLCNLGAAEILVPEFLLLKSVGLQKPLSRAEEVITLAKNFDVSLEVMIRQLQRFPQACAIDFAVVLVSVSREGDQLITAAFHDAWLLTHTRKPSRGLKYQAWLGNLVKGFLGGDQDHWEAETPAGTILFRRIQVTGRSFLLEMRAA